MDSDNDDYVSYPMPEDDFGMDVLRPIPSLQEFCEEKDALANGIVIDHNITFHQQTALHYANSMLVMLSRACDNLIQQWDGDLPGEVMLTLLHCLQIMSEVHDDGRIAIDNRDWETLRDIQGRAEEMLIELESEYALSFEERGDDDGEVEEGIETGTDEGHDDDLSAIVGVPGATMRVTTTRQMSPIEDGFRERLEMLIELHRGRVEEEESEVESAAYGSDEDEAA
jgi:hypothetical protein